MVAVQCVTVCVCVCRLYEAELEEVDSRSFCSLSCVCVCVCRLYEAELEEVESRSFCSLSCVCVCVCVCVCRLYEAELEEVDADNGTAAVTFSGYGNAEVVPLSALKQLHEGRGPEDESKSKSRREMIQEQREYKKKKAQKKVLRMKEIEQEREQQKSKWQQFNNKAYSKNKKGQVKRSIFASPESVNGKVGVGTCGIADKPMTQYHDTSKYNVRHLMPQ
ncbi:survival of motor neuron-related-splicing factor 30-like [Sardina pilchardus]|uniref:survival of motor neuron-related-splicing factor 30-like n=1 Tax=Sardina pilchardus TaxID=27697 RepID=UPI002E12B1FD